jgi:hypothetical protein
MPGTRIFFVSALCACAAIGQTTRQAFFFPEIESPAVLQSYLNTIRTIADIRDTSSDWTNKSITVQGSTDQVSLAAWIAQQLSAPPESRPALIRRDYPWPVAENHQVQIFYLAYTQSGPDLQELVNLTRSIADIQRFFPCQAITGIVARGTPEQLDMVGWVLNELDQPAGSLKPGHRDHPFPSDPRAGTAQLYVLANTDLPRSIQEIVNGTRSLADIQRCFPYNSRKVLAMRGTSDQIAFADWTLGLLDRPVPGPIDTAAHEYRYNDGPWPTIARVFFLNHIDNPQQLQQAVNEVRSATGILRAMPISNSNAIAVRGTGDQVSRAEQMLKDK